MKRAVLCLFAALTVLLSSCTPAEEPPSAAPSVSPESSAVTYDWRPEIRIAVSEVIIGKGDDFDL